MWTLLTMLTMVLHDLDLDEEHDLGQLSYC